MQESSEQPVDLGELPLAPPDESQDPSTSEKKTSATNHLATSDLIESADKKTKTTEAPPPESCRSDPTESDKMVSLPGGIIEELSNRFSTPVPVYDTQYIMVDSSTMDDYFSSVRTSLILALYPDERCEPTTLISETNWRQVCRYLLKARIDTVYEAISKRIVSNRIAIPRELELPKCLADVINGFGLCVVLEGAIRVVPSHIAEAGDANASLMTSTTADMLNKYASLVMAGKARGVIRTGFISNVPEGSTWWLLSPRIPSAPANNSSIDSDVVMIAAVFKEWTPADAVLAAIVARGFGGGIINFDAIQYTPPGAQAAVAIPNPGLPIMWTCNIISGVNAMRKSFNHS